MNLNSHTFYFFSLIILTLLVSCSKDDNSREINALKESVTTLQKRSDSLAAALGNTNSTVVTISKSIDSIKLQLAGIVLQLNNLNSQLSQLNANVLSLNAQITLLNKQYAELVDKLNQILSQLAVTPTSLNTGLVAYYPFSGNARDSSGNNNHGTVNGSTLTTDRFGNANKAYQFSNNTISVPHNPSLGIIQDRAFTISIWAFRTGSQGTQHFIGKRPSGAQAFNWQVCFNTGSKEGLLFSGNSNFTTYGAVSGKDCIVNSWINIIGVYNSGNWQLYENGILITSKNSTLFYNDVNTPLTIGNSGNFEPFYGKLDDIRIYNRALTQEEITYLATH